MAILSYAQEIKDFILGYESFKEYSRRVTHAKVVQISQKGYFKAYHALVNEHDLSKDQRLHDITNLKLIFMHVDQMPKLNQGRQLSKSIMPKLSSLPEYCVPTNAINA